MQPVNAKAATNGKNLKVFRMLILPFYRLAAFPALEHQILQEHCLLFSQTLRHDRSPSFKALASKAVSAAAAFKSTLRSLALPETRIIIT